VSELDEEETAGRENKPGGSPQTQGHIVQEATVEEARRANGKIECEEKDSQSPRGQRGIDSFKEDREDGDYAVEAEVGEQRI
jgi:hypothetical protein